MKTMDRRTFFRQAVGGATLVALPGALGRSSLLAEKAKRFAPDDRVTLGNTGLVTSRLALGSGTHGWRGSSNQTKLGLDNFVRIIRHGFERGITFWDAADQYGSHTYFREALKHLPREKLVILTKSVARTAEEMKKDLERFRKELATDQIDILLLHCMADAKWPEKMKGVMDVLSEARQKKIIRTFGVSCHDLGALKAAAHSSWAEVILARINHAGENMDASAEQVVPVLRQAKENGKCVLGMKLLGVGKLADQIDTSLGFVLGLGCVDAVTIGFESVQELDQLIDKIAALRI